jgi:hypothetical protein
MTSTTQADVAELIEKLRVQVPQETPISVCLKLDQAADTLKALSARLAEVDTENERLREAFAGIMPGKLCGESWDLPDSESVSISVTFGALRKARAAFAGKAEQ